MLLWRHPYVYGSTMHRINKSWHPIVDKLRDEVADTGFGLINSALCTHYRDGNSYIPPHADNEISLGKNPTIFSLSFAATRVFVLKRIASSLEISCDLNPGSLLIMGGRTQEVFHHSVPRSAKPCGARLNITFRNILNI